MSDLTFLFRPSESQCHEIAIVTPQFLSLLRYLGISNLAESTVLTYSPRFPVPVSRPILVLTSNSNFTSELPRPF